MQEATPKHLLISRRIAEHIQQGRWGDGRLPSVRSLAQDYGTSVVTASRAIQELVSRGVIATVERSGCFVRTAPPETVETWGVCLRLTRGPWRHATESCIRDGFAAAAEREGCRFRDDLFPPADASEGRLNQAAQEMKAAGVRGVFYLPSRVSEEAALQDEAFFRACTAAKLPVVLLERGVRGRPLRHDLIACDDLEGGRELTRHLTDAGRRRPAFVIGSPTSSHRTRLAGYLLAAHDAGVPACVIDQPADVPLKDAYGAVVDRVLASEADAVVCYQDYTAIGLIMELLNRGKRVPADVSVVGFEDLPIGSTFSIGITTYCFSFDEMATQGLRVMRQRLAHPTDPPVRVAIPGRLIVRESSGSGR